MQESLYVDSLNTLGGQYQINQDTDRDRYDRPYTADFNSLNTSRQAANNAMMQPPDASSQPHLESDGTLQNFTLLALT